MKEKNNKEVWARVKTEEEYWKKHKEMKKEIKKLFRSSYKMLNDPEGFIKKYELMLAKYEFIGVVSSEWVDGQRKRLYNELNKPSEFKESVVRAKDKLKSKGKKFFSRK